MATCVTTGPDGARKTSKSDLRYTKSEVVSHSTGGSNLPLCIHSIFHKKFVGVSVSTYLFSPSIDALTSGALPVAIILTLVCSSYDRDRVSPSYISSMISLAPFASSST